MRIVAGAIGLAVLAVLALPPAAFAQFAPREYDPVMPQEAPQPQTVVTYSCEGDKFTYIVEVDAVKLTARQWIETPSGETDGPFSYKAEIRPDRITWMDRKDSGRDWTEARYTIERSSGTLLVETRSREEPAWLVMRTKR